MPNPYNPQNPAKPDYFGGRVQALQIANDRLDRASRSKQSGGILVHGHRGVGKSSLLKKINDIASKDVNDMPKNTIVIYRRLSKTTSDTELYQILNEELLQKIEERRSIIDSLKKAGKNINGINIFQFGIDFGKEINEKTAYQRWKLYLNSLKNVDYVLVTIDDADYLSTEALGELKTIIEDSGVVPVILVISGGVQFESRLVDEYSPIARIFSGASINLSRFSPDETKEVLEKPLMGEENTKWSQEAINEVQEYTYGFPYLVQCLASASYKENSDITQEIVKTSKKSALSIARSWLNNEIKTASDQDIESFVKLVKLNNEVFKSSEINHAGVLSPYIGRLVKLGILKKENRGRYSLQKSPMIAIYGMLKRNLPLD